MVRATHRKDREEMPMSGATRIAIALFTVVGIASCATSGSLTDGETARISAEFKARQAQCASLPEASRPPECADLVKAQMEAERRREAGEDVSQAIGSMVLDTMIEGVTSVLGGGDFWTAY